MFLPGRYIYRKVTYPSDSHSSIDCYCWRFQITLLVNITSLMKIGCRIKFRLTERRDSRLFKRGAHASRPACILHSTTQMRSERSSSRSKALSTAKDKLWLIRKMVLILTRRNREVGQAGIRTRVNSRQLFKALWAVGSGCARCWI